MPEAVNTFIETNNYQEMYLTQQKILDSDFYDISHYATAPDKLGLLTSMFGHEAQQAILKGNLIGPVKGGIYENLIFDMLVKRGYKLYYYKTDNSTQEIEFLITKEQTVIPVEVKTKNGTTLSLNNYMAEYHPSFAYKLISGNVGVADCKVTLPLYMAMFI